MNELVSQNKESYNKIAGLFSQTRSFIWEDLKALKQYVQTGDSVLDVGCGNGRLLEVFKSSQTKYLGVDFSEGLIAEARKKYPDEEFQVVDVMDLDSMNKKFDVVFCVSVLNHFPKEMHEVAIKKIKSVLNPGGRLLMVNWDLWNLKRKKSVWRQKTAVKYKLLATGFKDVMTTWKSGKTQADLYYYAFTKREIKKLVEGNGFKIIKNYYSKAGKQACWLCGDNLVTVAQLTFDELEKKPSKIQGNGTFAKKKFEKGDEVYKIPMHEIRYENFKRYAYVGNGQYVNDEDVLNYVNHSCAPNIVLDIERPDPVLIAVKDIYPGEELVCNYDLTEVKGVYRKCNCGDKNCKGFFGRSKDFKSKICKCK